MDLKYIIKVSVSKRVIRKTKRLQWNNEGLISFLRKSQSLANVRYPNNHLVSVDLNLDLKPKHATRNKNHWRLQPENSLRHHRPFWRLLWKSDKWSKVDKILVWPSSPFKSTPDAEYSRKRHTDSLIIQIDAEKPSDNDWWSTGWRKWRFDGSDPVPSCEQSTKNIWLQSIEEASNSPSVGGRGERTRILDRRRNSITTRNPIPSRATNQTRHQRGHGSCCDIRMGKSPRRESQNRQGKRQEKTAEEITE